ncbi:MAG: hypothetical protein Q7S22_04635 [Candidatus Micrarchaeota archaeon]|nr:hypothetical protein [Candidatus Micrarchaeota archaeon]
MENIKYEHLFVMGIMLLPLASCFSLEQLTGLVKTNVSTKDLTKTLILPKENISNDTGDTEIEQQWVGITRDQVEKGCLKLAKRAAVDSGYSEGMVFNCNCNPQETPDTKIYDCNVNALDGSHSVAMRCIKTQNQCVVTSEQGTQSYNFDQLEQFVNN